MGTNIMLWTNKFDGYGYDIPQHTASLLPQGILCEVELCFQRSYFLWNRPFQTYIGWDGGESTFGYYVHR
jgi:hypothetical protein